MGGHTKLPIKHLANLVPTMTAKLVFLQETALHAILVLTDIFKQIPVDVILILDFLMMAVIN